MNRSSTWHGRLPVGPPATRAPGRTGLVAPLGAALVLGCFVLAEPIPGEEARESTSLEARDEPEGLALRIENFTVPPATGPLVLLAVENHTGAPFEGTVRLSAPERFVIVPEARDVIIAAGESARVPFNIKRGVNLEANRFAMEATATGSGLSVSRRQEVACHSAPYFRIQVDGDPEEWDDAIPVTFTTAGRATTVSTYWSRQELAVLVAVEQDALVPMGQSAAFDAVQIAVAPAGTATGNGPEMAAERWEFLLAAGEGGAAHAFLLAEPETPLGETTEPRPLSGREFPEVSVAVARREEVTYYECTIPFSLMRARLRPTEGREFRFSVLVHDPDSGGVRDLGAAAGLHPWQRTPWAWSRWEGDSLDDTIPFDNRIEWGMCASKH